MRRKQKKIEAGKEELEKRNGRARNNRAIMEENEDDGNRVEYK